MDSDDLIGALISEKGKTGDDVLLFVISVGPCTIGGQDCNNCEGEITLLSPIDGMIEACVKSWTNSRYENNNIIQLADGSNPNDGNG